MDHNLKYKCETIKILKDNIGEILTHWFGFFFFFYKTPKAQYTKENN